MMMRRGGRKRCDERQARGERVKGSKMSAPEVMRQRCAACAQARCMMIR